MARGLSTIVPERALRLFTWQELETLVCGQATVDVAFWREHTDYSGYSADSPVIKAFWEVSAWVRRGGCACIPPQPLCRASAH